MKMKNNLFFSEFRSKDYRIPRSMREAYGYEATLWVEEPDRSFGSWIWWIIAFVGIVIWVGCGWI